MKRSEMLQLMCDTDKGYRMCVSSTGDYKKDELNRMDNILKTLEKAGMLPPFKKEPCFCSMRGTCPTCAPNLYKSQWEPEDG